MLGFKVAKYLFQDDLTFDLKKSLELIKLNETSCINEILNDIIHQIVSNTKDENCCLARLWDKGDYGRTQCKEEITNGCLCLKHHNSLSRMNGKWWLGLITEERPEKPYHPISGFHNWTKDIHGNDYIKVNKAIENPQKDIKDTKIKRPRGRPKGSKNKKK
tara:strand:+ start:1310 stop:1792 length:483 start_codon:yes stop_codon:yes gene_type:complete